MIDDKLLKLVFDDDSRLSWESTDVNDVYVGSSRDVIVRISKTIGDDGVERYVLAQLGHDGSMVAETYGSGETVDLARVFAVASGSASDGPDASDLEPVEKTFDDDRAYQIMDEMVVRSHSHQLSVRLVTIFVDLVFLAGVVGLNFVANRYLFDRFELSGPTSLVAEILQWAFLLATTTVAISSLAGDLLGVVRSAVDTGPTTAVAEPRPVPRTKPVDATPEDVPDILLKRWSEIDQVGKFAIYVLSDRYAFRRFLLFLWGTLVLVFAVSVTAALLGLALRREAAAALVAIVIVSVALALQRRRSRRRAKGVRGDSSRAEASPRAQLRLSIVRAGRSERLVIENTGNAVAQEVQILSSEPAGDGGQLNLIAYEPIASLQPGGTMRLLVAVTFGTAAQHDLVVAWREGDQVFEETHTLSIF